MTHALPRSPETVTVDIALSGADWELRTKMSVPTGPTRLMQLLPLLQTFTDALVDAAVRVTEEEGRTISCRKGCGACCRQLVPISAVEARHIGALVEGLPEPRRTAIRARFAGARRQLDEASLLEELLHPEQWPESTGQTFGLRYFQQGIPCPFLEEEACSIYADRPLACREYLVTSPREHCARPTAATVQCVKLPLRVWTAMARCDPVPPSARYIRWVPLILAPEWAKMHPDVAPQRPGPEVLQEFFEHLTSKQGAVPQPTALPLTPISGSVSTQADPGH